MFASRYSNEASSNEIVEILLNAGANVNDQAVDGWTALMMASRNSDSKSNNKTVQILLNAGADPNIQDKDGRTALMHAVYSAQETVQTLLDAGANTLIRDNNGTLASDLNDVKILYVAEYRQKLSYYSSLFAKKTKLNNKDVWGLILKKKWLKECTSTNLEALGVVVGISNANTQAELRLRISEVLAVGGIMNLDTLKSRVCQTQRFIANFESKAKQLVDVGANATPQEILAKLLMKANLVWQE